MSTRKTLTISCIILISLITAWLLRGQISQALSWFNHPQAISQALLDFGAWGVLVFFVLFILQTFIAFIPGQALMLASAYIYGFWGGLLLTWISLVIGGQAAFWLARRYGRSFTNRWVSPAILERWNRNDAWRGITFFTLALVLPIFPNDAMCYVAGLGRISARRFFIANVLGRGLASLATALVGAYGTKLPVSAWMLAGAILLLVLGWRVVSSRRAASRSHTDCSSLDYRFYRTCLRASTRLFSSGLQISGLQNLPPGPKIIAANHTVGSDPLFVPVALPEQVHTLLQDGLFKYPLLGWLLRRSGQICVQRNTAQAKSALECAVTLLQDGETVLIFPEGKLVPPGERISAKTGAVRMALASGAPIIPLGIYVDQKDTVLLRGKDKSMLWQVRGQCHLCFGRPWRPNPQQTDLHQSTEDLMDAIYALVAQAQEDASPVLEPQVSGGATTLPIREKALAFHWQ